MTDIEKPNLTPGQAAVLRFLKDASRPVISTTEVKELAGINLTKELTDSMRAMLNAGWIEKTMVGADRYFAITPAGLTALAEYEKVAK
jgi:predicted MarR family transcription regulator